MNQKKLLRNVGIVYATFILSMGAFYHGNTGYLRYKAKKNLNGVPAERMTKNGELPITLPVGTDAIKVYISENFTSEQQQHIVKAISELDEYFDGIKYDILLDPEQVDDKVIKIEKNYHDNRFPGVTTFMMQTYNILYPMEIEFNSKYDDYDSQFFEAVIKHEMLHTLGLDDMYDEKYSQRSIMYRYIGSQTLRDLSQEDIDIVNTIYTIKNTKKPVLAVKTSVDKEPIVIFNGELLKYNKEEDEMIM